MIREREVTVMGGAFGLAVTIALFAAAIYIGIGAVAQARPILLLTVAVPLALLAFFSAAGLFTVQPNQAVVLIRTELQERLRTAGVEVIEARLSHLAYAPEIAGAMLQRQQAAAIIAARQRIVDGAVGMVEMALERLQANNVVALDDERRA